MAEKKEPVTFKKGGTEIGKAMAEKSRGLFSADDWQCKSCGNVNWARRTACNMCNAPKYGRIEPRTGYGGGYMERDEVVEYIERNESDGEYDEFGRKKKKFRKIETPDKIKPKSPVAAEEGRDAEISKYKLDSEQEEEEDDDDDDEDGDLSKYNLVDSDEEEEEQNNRSKSRKSGSRTSSSRSRSRSTSRSRSSSSSSGSRSRSPSGSRSRSQSLSSSGSSHSHSSRSRSRSRSSSVSSSTSAKHRSSPRRKDSRRTHSGSRSR